MNEEEIENEIKLLTDFILSQRESIKSSTAAIASCEDKKDFLEKQLSELPKEFKRNPMYVLGAYRIGDDVIYEGRGFDILDATLFMKDVANQCNAMFNSAKFSTYYLIMEYEDEESKLKHKTTDYNIGNVRFNSKESITKAIQIIESNPEWTRLAKIYLGVTEWNNL